jgi:hypothetical protein
VALSGYDNEIYNQYDWDSVHNWDVTISATSGAFTESNHLAHLRDTMTRSNRTEKLYIKEA